MKVPFPFSKRSFLPFTIFAVADARTRTRTGGRCGTAASSSRRLISAPDDTPVLRRHHFFTLLPPRDLGDVTSPIADAPGDLSCHALDFRTDDNRLLNPWVFPLLLCEA